MHILKIRNCLLRKTYRHIIPTVLFAAMLTTGCSSIDCNINGRVMCHYALQDGDGNSVQLQYPLSVTFHREYADSDTIYINQQSNVASLDLPMSYNADTDEIALTLTIDQDTEITDVVRIKKTNIPQFESVDCAPRYHHEIEAISSTHNFIDTVIVNNPKVSNNASVTNIYLRLRGSSN